MTAPVGFDSLHPMCDVLQLADENGAVIVDFIAAEPDVLVTDFDMGFPEPREVAQNRAVQNGVIDTTQFFGARAVSFTLSIQPRYDYAGALEFLAKLRALCVPNRRPFLYVRMADEPGTTYRMQLRADSISGPQSWNMTPQVQWKAADGVLETQAPNEIFIHPDVDTSNAGWFAPFSAPFNAGSGFAAGAVEVTVDGTLPTPPVLTVWGPCTGPISIVNQTTGEGLYFPALDIDLGHNVVIDCAAHTVYADGDPAASRLSYRDPATSTFWWLQPGANEISFQPTNPGADCVLVMQWRNRKL